MTDRIAPVERSTAEPTRDVGIFRTGNDCYLRLVLTDSGESRDEFRISVGAADVLRHEIDGLLASPPASDAALERAAHNKGVEWAATVCEDEATKLGGDRGVLLDRMAAHIRAGKTKPQTHPTATDETGEAE